MVCLASKTWGFSGRDHLGFKFPTRLRFFGGEDLLPRGKDDELKSDRILNDLRDDGNMRSEAGKR
jgi:hypothetical protein